MFRIVTMCYGSETPPSPPPPFPNLFGHTVQFFSVIPSPYACRGELFCSSQPQQLPLVYGACTRLGSKCSLIRQQSPAN